MPQIGTSARTVTHPDRSDIGTVIDSPAPAWTPDELSPDAPDDAMVKVRWSDSADPTQLYWEYLAELHLVQPTTPESR